MRVVELLHERTLRLLLSLRSFSLSESDLFWTELLKLAGAVDISLFEAPFAELRGLLVSLFAFDLAVGGAIQRLLVLDHELLP